MYETFLGKSSFAWLWWEEYFIGYGCQRITPLFLNNYPLSESLLESHEAYIQYLKWVDSHGYEMLGLQGPTLSLRRYQLNQGETEESRLI